MIAIITDILASQIFENNFFLNTAHVGTVMQSMFIFRAVNKYNLLSIGVKEVDHDLFSNIQDGIFLTDNSQSVIQINDAAKNYFHLHDIDIKDLQLMTLFEDYNFSQEYSNHETETTHHGEVRVVSLSQATIKQSDLELGKILIVRNITASKQAESELRHSKQALEKLAGELATANALLEQKVAERTQLLRASNAQLRQQIAEREHAEAERAAEQERLAVTLSSIGDGVITTDTTGQIVLLNKAAEQLTGWPHGQAMGQPLPHIFQIRDERTRAPRQSAVEEALDRSSSRDSATTC